MSTNASAGHINLSLYEILDPELLDEGIRLRLIRLICYLRFATSEGWSGVERAIVDTGAPVAVIPWSIGNRIAVRPLSTRVMEIHGISADDQEQPFVPARLAEVTCVLLDQTRVSPSLRLKAYLMPDDATPLVLGFEDLLTSYELLCNYVRNETFLSLPLPRSPD